MKKILVVRYRFIGDMILTIPFLRNLRYNCPDAQIDMLVAPNSGEIIEDCPYVNNFIYFDTTRKHKYEKAQEKKKSFWNYVFLLRKQKYDKVYILKRSMTSALLCFFAGIKERIGFDTERRGFLLTKRVEYDTQKHESLCFLDVLKADNMQVKDYYLENWIKDENKNNVLNLLKKYNVKDEKLAVVNITATNEYKMWKKENFVEIIKYLSDEKNVRVLYIGAPVDRDIYEKLNFGNELKNPPVNLCGEVSLKDSLALLSMVDLFIGNDSGNLHMASSAGTKVIGLYGPMPFEKWRALGENNILIKADLPCIPCSLKGKCTHDKECMNAIGVDTVKFAVDKIFP